MDFDEEGKHYFVDSEHVWAADDFEFVSSAYVNREDLTDRILYVTFSDGFLADFDSEEVASDVDNRLKDLNGISDVYQEDREFFHFFYEQGTDLADLVKRIDAKLKELSQEE